MWGGVLVSGVIMKERLAVVNAFVHDVATGTWIAILAMLTLFHRETSTDAWSAVSHLVPALEQRFLLLSWLSLGVIAITGVVRALTFRLFGWTGDVAADRVRLLKAKHALLGIVFTAGMAYQLALVHGS